MASRIAIRVDTAANWAAANPTLVAGEQGYESDTKRRKVGDGVTAWNSLPYAVDLKRPTVVKSAAYTMTIDDYETEIDSSGGAVTITLPDLATAIGRDFVIRKISSDSNTVTIQRAGTDTITRAGLTSVTLTSDGDWWKLHAGSTRWELVDGVEVIPTTGGQAEKYSSGVAKETGSITFSVSAQASKAISPRTFAFTPTDIYTIPAIVNGFGIDHFFAIGIRATTSDSVTYHIHEINNVNRTGSWDALYTMHGRWYT